MNEIGAHDRQDAQSQAGRPLGVSHLEDERGVKNNQSGGRRKQRQQHPARFHNKEPGDRNQDGKAGNPQPQDPGNRQLARRRRAASAAERGALRFIIQAASGIEIIVENIHARVGHQKAERGQKRVAEIKRRAEEPGFIPGDSGSQNAQRERQDQKRDANNGDDAFKCHEFVR